MFFVILHTRSFGFGHSRTLENIALHTMYILLYQFHHLNV